MGFGLRPDGFRLVADDKTAIAATREAQRSAGGEPGSIS